ncbi:MAG: GHKL domain-containing protein [Balneolaceae bacterium]|nr:MAG: GHKL domain-containing protein [Balneolaceae bacterium]
MNKKELILANQDKLLEAMLNKDEPSLRKLIHPEASVFGSAIHEFEKGIEHVLHYYTESLALLPDDKKVHIKSRQYTDLNNQALVEQEFDIQFTLEGKQITLLTLRQTALWTRAENANQDDPAWLLLHDHTSMPDHLGAFETISSNELLEGNLNLEFETESLKKKLNKSLADLKIAQQQLIQKEKLASIGQLTAGIAHEIKNPLNFVNNFSEVILELVEEIREEVRLGTGDGGPGEMSPLEGGEDGKAVQGDVAESDIGKDSEANQNPASTPLNPSSHREPYGARGDLILEILDDIESNIKRIYEHGKRADSIVKSMLLHSRGKSGKPVPTNLNAILDEYTKLAYHAMRAADSSFNVDIKTDFDQRMPHIKVIPQDMSRAFLNIINNAMYAADEFARSQADRKPYLQISTSFGGQNAEIRIKDNGAGIPSEIREKIFQPFFSTKPSGAGTGLGLSMTYDIIKMHEGTLKINSEPNQFTEFIITLPQNNKE